ncbi:MAG: ATPase, partial [Firmicutes bacterium]|nr:ATPase [Bacillota bacterium]
MSGNTRHLFPGNNTSGGFFSYYGEILPLDRANRFYCLKGGPGTGKSTFLRKIAEDLQRKGWDTEYLHCSSDSDSLDGVCFPEQRVALIDGTAPHMTDPVSPGAVDRMVDLSVCWDEGKLRGRREEIRASQKQIAAYFRSAYRYLGAARKLYEGLEELNCLDRSALHYLAARIQREELAHKALMPRAGGRLRKLFLTGITPKGIVTYLPELLQQARRVYAFQVRLGADCTPLLNSVAESALARGCDAELFYNPLKPAEQAMHLYLPEEKLAVVTVFADREEAEL